MLLLKRKPGQSVIIKVGKTKIVVIVNRIKGSDVQLGFEAPKEAKILRSEIGEIL